MPLIEPRLFDHPSAWRGEAMRQRDDWIVEFSAADNRELREALAYAHSRGAEIPTMTREDFPLPQLEARLTALRDVVVQGRGFALVRGLDISALSVKEAAHVYWGIGTHLGRGCAQNAQGDMLGHVTDLGLDYRVDPKARGYQTKLDLPFHSDQRDVVGLICLRRARSGGLSRIISSTTIHNLMVERRPDLARALYQPLAIDRRGEARDGGAPFYMGSVFEWAGDRLFCRYQRPYYESAQRFENAPRLTTEQIQAFDMVDELGRDPSLHLDMEFRPGDMQFLCNYITLHSRTEYEDWPEPERSRYLLRLWLNTGLLREFPASWLERFKDLEAWERTPKPPIFDLSRRQAELAH